MSDVAPGYVYMNSFRRALNFLGFTASGAFESGALALELVGFSPKDGQIPISANITIQGNKNLFQDTAFDGSGSIIKSPNFLNSAVLAPIDVLTLWLNLGAGGPGDQVEVQIRIVEIQLEAGITLGALPETTLTQIKDVDGVGVNDLFSIPFTIPGGTFKRDPAKLYAVSVTRDARAGNANDTHTGDIILMGTQIVDDITI